MKRNSLRLGSLFVLFAMLFTLLTPGAAFAATPDYATALNRMHALGIIPANANDPNQVISRMILVETIVNAEGMTGTANKSKGPTPFPDIASGSVESGYINAGLNIGTTQGVNEGVVYGTANGNFQPNTPVTFAEACTIAVRLLGYKDSDSDLTGTAWPNNYIQEASTLDLTAGLSLSRSSILTLKDEAVIFNNLFDSALKSSTGANTKFFSDNYYNDTTATGTLTELIVLGNSKSSDNLASNQILTNSNSASTLTLNPGVNTPVLGGKYKLYVSGTNVTKVAVNENTLENYQIKTISGAVVGYAAGKGGKATHLLRLPRTDAYYYHGTNVDYATAQQDIYPGSSLILAQNSNGNGYEYAVVVDPYTSNTTVSGSVTESIILGNSKSSDNLSSNQVITNGSSSALTLGGNVSAPALGGKYRIYINGTTLTKAYVNERSLASYTVNSVSGSTVSYTSGGKSGSMTLPQAGSYYYHGTAVDYSTALSDLYPSTTLILAKIPGANTYDYAVIVDPYSGDTVVSGTSHDGVVILGTSQTDSTLNSNQVETSIGELTLAAGVPTPDVGAKYKMYVSGTSITKLSFKENTPAGYAVSSIDSSGSSFEYVKADDNSMGTMTLPQADTYYYNGNIVDYTTAQKSILNYSSLLLSKASSGNYEYALILDPCYGTPSVYSSTNVDLLNKLSAKNYNYIYRETSSSLVNNGKVGNITLDDLNQYDVLYFVSDLWGKNTFIYDYEHSVYGTITAFTPNKMSPTAITVGSASYTLSPYFDRSLLGNYNGSVSSFLNTINVGDFKQFILGINNQIVDIVDP